MPNAWECDLLCLNSAISTGYLQEKREEGNMAVKIYTVLKGSGDLAVSSSATTSSDALYRPAMFPWLCFAELKAFVYNTSFQEDNLKGEIVRNYCNLLVYSGIERAKRAFMKKELHDKSQETSCSLVICTMIVVECVQLGLD